ncbi:hypothetical protein DFJ73DRAFT_539597 [Zopfochytrium polystomum]|nr:hypothetical protein DFJ73DRAFT_539597 [Zopfochytrium polystomum]
MGVIVGGGLPNPEYATNCYKDPPTVGTDHLEEAKGTLSAWRNKNPGKATMEDVILSDSALAKDHLTGTQPLGTSAAPLRASAILASFASHHLLLLHWSLICRYLSRVMIAGGELMLAAVPAGLAVLAVEDEDGVLVSKADGGASPLIPPPRSREANLLSHILSTLATYLASYAEAVAAVREILERAVTVFGKSPAERLDAWRRDVLAHRLDSNRHWESVEDAVKFVGEIQRSIGVRAKKVVTQLSGDVQMLAWCADRYDAWISPLLLATAVSPSTSSPSLGGMLLSSVNVLGLKSEISGSGGAVIGKGKGKQLPSAQTWTCARIGFGRSRKGPSEFRKHALRKTGTHWFFSGK